MPETPEPFVELYPSSPTAELYCPHCGYDLSGTTEDRCSECGHKFDRAALIEWATGHMQPLPFGPLTDVTERNRLFEISLFSPARLGRWLPPHADTFDAATYSRHMRLWAGLGVPIVFSVIVACAHVSIEALISPLIAPLPVMMGPAICEDLIASLLRRVPARAVPRETQYEFWRTLSRCFSGYLALTAVLFCLAMGLLLLIKASWIRRWTLYWEPLVLSLPYLALIATGLWWWRCLTQAILARGEPCAARTIAICLIPIIAVGSTALGAVIAIGETGLLIACCSKFH